jgi:acetyltransferase-like isoleucine patch superfamily enzyme
MSLKTKLGTFAREWGYGTASGLREVCPMRFRGEIARRRYVTEGGANLLVRDHVEIVKRDGGGQPLSLGANVYLAEYSRLVFEGPDGRMELGDNVFINARSEIRARELVRVGCDSILAFDVVVMDTNHHDIEGALTTAPTVIGSRVWIGARATVLRGVTIGDGAVVGAGSVVTQDVSAGTLVAGNPARVLRRDVRWRR